MRAAFGTGVRAGALPGAVIGVVYFLANHDTDLPWLRIGSILAIYGPAVGILVATLIELFVLVFDRIARLGHRLHLVFNPIIAGGLGGAIAGIAPGIVAVVVFGGYHGPFAGTGLIAFGLISGSMMIAIPAARRARAARQRARDDRAIAAAAVIATLIVCAVAAVIAPMMVDAALARARTGVAATGPVIGTVSGLIAGGIAGIYIGLVITLGRVLRR